MLDLVLIILLIISLFKPDILLSKKLKEKANDEQKKILTKNLRKIYAVTVASFESISLTRYNILFGGILLIICLILLFTISLPAAKENSKLIKELNQ